MAKPPTDEDLDRIAEDSFRRGVKLLREVQARHGTDAVKAVAIVRGLLTAVAFALWSSRAPDTRTPKGLADHARALLDEAFRKVSNLPEGGPK